MNRVKIIIFAVCLVLAFQAASYSLTPEKDAWTPDAQDQRRALPNVTTPPERREPTVQLAPREDEGIVRWVALP